jgi:hypothetical protein
MNKTSIITVLAGLAIGAAGFEARAADSFQDGCETIEPTWKTATQNGGTVEADDSLKRAGSRSVKLRWKPGPAIAPDGTASSQSRPTEAGYASIATQRKIPVSDAAKYKLSYWVRTEGDIGWKSPQDNAVLTVELRYTVKDKDGKKSTVTHSMIDADPHRLWTQIADFKTHPSSGYMPGQVLTELTPPPGATDVELVFSLRFMNKIASAWIDDIELTKVENK